MTKIIIKLSVNALTLRTQFKINIVSIYNIPDTICTILVRI